MNEHLAPHYRIHVPVVGMIFSLFAAVFPAFANAVPMDVAVVTNLGDSDPVVSYIRDNFSNVNSLTTGTFTSAHSNTTQNQQIIDAELVVVSNSNAGTNNYDDSAAEVDFWNGLPQPLVLLSGGLARSHRWVWVGTTSTGTATDDTETRIVDSTDPLLAATTISTGRADLYNDGLASGWPRAGNSAVGGGEILGTALNSSSQNLIGIVRYAAGSALATGTRGTRTTHGGDRLLLAGGALDSLTSEGLEVLVNALIEAGLEFSSSINAQNDAYSLYENASWTEQAVSGLLANDFDNSGTAAAMIVSGPSSGSLQLNTDGSFTYTPNADFAGTDSFTYHLESGGLVSNTATVTLDVQPAPTGLLIEIQEVTTGRTFGVADMTVGAPLYYGTNQTFVDTYSTGLEGSKILQGTWNELDYHGPDLGDGTTDPSKLVRFFVSQPVTVYINVHGVFTHLPDWLGPHHGWSLSTESYGTSDDSGVVFEKHFPAGSHWLGANDRPPGGWVDRTYWAVIAPQAGDGNNPPYAWRDFYDLGGVPSLTVNAADGVTANDTDTNGDTLNVTLVKDAAFGDLILNADGSFDYVPGPDFTRWDSFQYRVTDGLVDGNINTAHILNGQPIDQADHQGPHDMNDPLRSGEHASVFKLAPHHTATHIAVASGDWSDSAIWKDGILPVDNANVLIPEGVSVTVDDLIVPKLRMIRADGNLRFETTTDAELIAGTVLVNTTGSFEMGSAAEPVEAGVRARLVIADFGPVDTVWDPHQLGRGLISHGPVRMYGQDVSDFLPLAVVPSAGATELVLKESPVNWQVGDTIVIPSTYRDWSQYEERTISSIAGDTVTVEPLVNDRSVPAPDLEVHVAHLTRNVEIVSENPTLMHRGHVMFMHTNDVQVHNAMFNDLGRTDKSIHNDDALVLGDGTLMPLSGTNVRARYSLHFHRGGGALTDTPGVVEGSVANGNPGWAFVNHSSYVNFTDNVAYDVFGAGFNAEAGDEAGSFHHNMAVAIDGTGGSPKEFRRFDNWGFDGDGWWIQGGNVETTDNIAASCKSSGFAFWLEGLHQVGVEGPTFIPVERMLDPSWAAGADSYIVNRYPVQNFSGNTSYGSERGVYAWNISGHDDGAKSNLNNHTAWRIRYGVTVDYAGDYQLNNFRLRNDLDNPDGRGVQLSGAVWSLVITNPDIRGFDLGIRAGLIGDAPITGGVLQNKSNITFDLSGHRTINVTGTEMLWLPGREGSAIIGGHLKGSEPALGRAPQPVASYDVETLNFCAAEGDCTEFWYNHQHADYVPYPSSEGKGPVEHQDLTNQQLWDQFGLAVAGQIAPADAFSIPEIGGLINELPYFIPPRLILDDTNFQVDEATSVGTVVGTAVADSADPTVTLTWDITAGNTGGAFAIDPATGEITLAAPLDKDLTPNFALTVAVNDDGGLSDTAMFTMDVINQTDVPVVYEAEDAVYAGPAFSTQNAGYSGTGFVDYQNNNNDLIEWTVYVPLAGQYNLAFRYALGSGTNRPLELKVNGVQVDPSLDFPGTGGWGTWALTPDVEVALNAGANTVRTTAIGSSGGNIDYLSVQGPVSFIPQPNVDPTAAFGSNCPDLDCNFTDSSSDSDGMVVSWFWDFGDGNTATAQNPSHSYAAAGIYTVTLTIADNDGATDNFVADVIVSLANTGPTTAFGFACSGLDCSFTDASGDGDGSIAAWTWDFGDGNGSGAQSPAHSYASPGTYTVTLNVTDDDGAGDGASRLVTVATAGATVGKKSLVIMLDGLRADGIVNANTPAMDSLINGSFGGGAYQGSFAYYAQTVQDAPTRSAWNHTSIMTGVGGQHGVGSNNAAGFQDVDYNIYPTYLTSLESAVSSLNTVFLATWPDDFAMVTGADYEKESDDAGNVANLLNIINGTHVDASGTNSTTWVAGTDVDAIALFLDDIDAAGHVNGFNADIPAYIAEIEAVDAQISQVLTAIQARPGFAGEDWQIVITTDHGGDDGGHGSMTPNHETIPFIVAGKATSQGLLDGTVINFDTAATVLAHMLGDASIPSHYEGVPQGDFVTAPAPADLTDSLVVYLPFDGDFLDASGNGNDSSIGAGSDLDPVAQTSGGLFGGYVEINDLGGGDINASYLTLGNPADLEFGTATDFTIITWFRAQADQTGDPVIIGNKDWVSGLNVGTLLLANEGNGDDFGFNISDGSVRRDIEPIDYSLNEWWFQAATVDRDGNAVMFVGSPTGELFVISDFADDLGDVSSSLPWNIGQDGLGNYPHNLDGDIDEMAIWRRALTLDEIEGLYNGGAGIYLGDLLGGGNTPPTAGISYVCTDLECSFIDNSTDNDGTLESWAWDFGDGSISNTQNPGHTYASEGLYSVSLTVIDNGGLEGNTSTSVTVTSPDPQPPAAPTNLTATVEKQGGGKNAIKSVTLNWEDNSNNEDYFVIERCEESGRGKTKVCTFAELTTTTAPTFNESGLIGTFKYRVKAVNGIGSSLYSNEVKI